MRLQVGKYYKIGSSIYILAQTERSPTKRSCYYYLIDLHSGRPDGGHMRCSENNESRDLTSDKLFGAITEINTTIIIPETEQPQPEGVPSIISRDGKLFFLADLWWRYSLIDMETGRAITDKPVRFWNSLLRSTDIRYRAKPKPSAATITEMGAREVQADPPPAPTAESSIEEHIYYAATPERNNTMTRADYATIIGGTFSG